MKLIITEKWSKKYKRSINCDSPKGFSQRAHCQGRKKNESLTRLTLKENSVVLDEATLKFAENNVSSYVQHVIEIGTGRSKEYLWTENLPFAETLYLNNRFIKAGLPIFYHANVSFEPLKTKEYEDNWDKEKKEWKPEYINQFLELSYPLLCVIDITDGARGRSSTGNTHTEPNKRKAIVSVNPTTIDPYNFSNDLALVVRHELQHTSQILNEMVLKYGQSVISSNGDFSKIKAVEIQQSEKFGRGQKRFQTGLKQPSVPITAGSPQSEKDTYFADDVEFETWVQDFVEEYYNFLIKYGVIKIETLKYGKLNATANELIGNLFQENSILRDTFFSDSKFGGTFQAAFDSLYRLRRREFITDLRANFEEFLKKKMKKFLASRYPTPSKNEPF